MSPRRYPFFSRNNPKDFLNGGRYSLLFGGTSSGKQVNETTTVQKTGGTRVRSCPKPLQGYR